MGRNAKCHPTKPHRARGLCRACYQRLWRKGKASQIIERRLVTAVGFEERQKTRVQKREADRLRRLELRRLERMAAQQTQSGPPMQEAA